MHELADNFEYYSKELIDILSLENGKIRDEATFKVLMVPSKLRYAASVAMTDCGRVWLYCIKI